MILSLLVYEVVAMNREYGTVPPPDYSFDYSSESDYGSEASESDYDMESCNLMVQSCENKGETVQVSCSSEFGSCDLAKYIDLPYQYTYWQPPRTQRYQQSVPHTVKTNQCIQCNKCSHPYGSATYRAHMRLESCTHGCRRYREYTRYRNEWRTKAKFETT